MEYVPYKVAYGYDPQSRAYVREANAYCDLLASIDTESVYTLPANAVWDSSPSEPLSKFMRHEHHDKW